MRWKPVERLGEALLVAVASTSIVASVQTCVHHRDAHHAAAVEAARLQGESDEEVLDDVGSDDLRDRLRAIERRYGE